MRSTAIAGILLSLLSLAPAGDFKLVFAISGLVFSLLAIIQSRDLWTWSALIVSIAAILLYIVAVNLVMSPSNSLHQSALDVGKIDRERNLLITNIVIHSNLSEKKVHMMSIDFFCELYPVDLSSLEVKISTSKTNHYLSSGPIESRDDSDCVIQNSGFCVQIKVGDDDMFCETQESFVLMVPLDGEDRLDENEDLSIQLVTDQDQSNVIWDRVPSVIYSQLHQMYP